MPAVISVMGAPAKASGTRACARRSRIAANNTITRDLILFHPKVVTAMCHKLVNLDEGARIQKQVNAFVGS